MKRLLCAFFFAATLALMATQADAGIRFGGAKTFGRSAPALIKKTPAAPKATAPKATAPKAAGAAQPRAAAPVGFVGRVATWLGIAALVSALGLAPGLATLLTYFILFMAFMFVIRLLGAVFLTQGSSQSAAYGRPTVRQPIDEAPQETPIPEDVSTQETIPLPKDFDVEAFLRVAREHFEQLQKAWGKGDIETLDAFTDNGVYLEVVRQLRERAETGIEIEIVTLQTEFRGIVRDGDDYLAGVHFDGVLNCNGKAERVDETWILAKPVSGRSGWLISGIIQEGQGLAESL